MKLSAPLLFVAVEHSHVFKDVLTTDLSYNGYYICYKHNVSYVDIHYEGTINDSATVTLHIKYNDIDTYHEVKLHGISTQQVSFVCDKLREYLQFKDNDTIPEKRFVTITNDDEKLMVECENITGSERKSETMTWKKVMTKEFKATLCGGSLNTNVGE